MVWLAKNENHFLITGKRSGTGSASPGKLCKFLLLHVEYVDEDNGKGRGNIYSVLTQYFSMLKVVYPP